MKRSLERAPFFCALPSPSSSVITFFRFFQHLSLFCTIAIVNFLQKPFPAHHERRQILISALSFGVFVALFLAFFQPFGMSVLGSYVMMVATGYGAITTVCMLLAQLLLPAVFRNYYNENLWNTGREIAQVMINLFLIALANWVFSVTLGFFALNFYSLLQFLVFTAIVGIFPVTIQVLVRQNNYHRRYSESSDQLNTQLRVRNEFENTNQSPLTITDEHGKPALELNPDKLLAAESADNYVKVYFEGENGLQHEMVRNSLSALENTLAYNSRFFRTHRSWLVNLRRIEKVKGNARGYILRLADFDKEIPVARSRIGSFDDAVRNG